jgi:hypothetical protein
MRTPALALLAFFAATAASAPNITGVWSFKTEAFAGGCVMTGQLVVKKASRNGVHQCHLTTHEKCPAIEGGAEESCTLDERNGAVTITSKIIKGPANAAYSPDDFSPKVESEQRMTGRLSSGGGGAPVVFYRGPAVVS